MHFTKPRERVRQRWSKLVKPFTAIYLSETPGLLRGRSFIRNSF